MECGPPKKYDKKKPIEITTETYGILEIKPCGLGFRIQDMEAESHN